MINKNSKIFIAGHNGLIGSAILRKLKDDNYKNLYTKSKTELDLRDQKKVLKYFLKTKPDAVILSAAKVGGIEVNNRYRGEFIYDNLSIQNNVIHSSYISGVKDLIFLGSSCIYPKICKQPIKEKYLLSGYLEKTNEPYAIAKIAGINLCESYNQQYKLNYKCLMPCNSYGPNDNYDLQNSHFFAALIKKIVLAKSKKEKFLNVWGSGMPKRELIYVDDIAQACLYFMTRKTSASLINIGSGKDKTIKEYARILIKFFGADLKIKYDKSKPDGVKRKLLNISLAKKYGWRPKTSLEQGIKLTLNYLKERSNFS